MKLDSLTDRHSQTNFFKKHLFDRVLKVTRVSFFSFKKENVRVDFLLHYHKRS